MSDPFAGLQPEHIWKHFAAITRIPHCSGNEEATAQYVLKWATDHGFDASRDKLGNVLVRVPATEGVSADAPTIVLQGHLDMVGEKDNDSPHDFDKDPIAVLRDGDFLTADRTTLGADNGIGVAACLAVAEDADARRGPLELLMTVDEETGLTGAAGLEPGWLKGRTLLNLDSEEPDALYVGCAGGVDTQIFLPIKREKAEATGYQLRVSGLQGGHSGLDINLGRGNAVQMLAQCLDRLRQAGVAFRLADLRGGDKHNAIPRDATALVSLDKPDAAKSVIDSVREDMTTVYGRAEPSAELTFELSDDKLQQVLVSDDANRVLDLLLALPHGVLAMSQAIPELVETSTNLAVARLDDDKLAIRESSRSSVMPALYAVRDSLHATARLAGASAEAKDPYPGWQPNPDSPLLQRARNVHEKVTGKQPAIKAIHAGLECGIIGEKHGGMDMISFGPHIDFPHSPSERLKIDTVGPFYDFLRALLADLTG